ncbi:MAG: matrixin family metalloprotease [Actinomycetota bacterium]|nr:matrixin family metalloprotease [Actinomycetota bacterium]
MSDEPKWTEKRNPHHPLRRPRDYLPDGNRRRTWFKHERKYRLAYRRRPFATFITTVAAVIATSLAGVATTSVVGSIFANSAFAGSGWALCSSPITWTTDTSNLTAAQAALVRPDLEAAFAAWSKASGLAFADKGEVPVKYDDSTTKLQLSQEMNRNIAVYFVPDSESSIITRSVVGYGTPTRVFSDTNEIVAGYFVVSTDYLVRTNSERRRVLFMHELGHALGLADSDDPDNIMFRYLDTTVKLGPGDVAGILAIEKACSR